AVISSSPEMLHAYYRGERLASAAFAVACGERDVTMMAGKASASEPPDRGPTPSFGCNPAANGVANAAVPARRHGHALHAGPLPPARPTVHPATRQGRRRSDA